MANEKKYLDFAALGYYDGKLKAWVTAADEAVLDAAKKYTDEADFDPAGTAQTKVDALANGQVKDNMDAIAKLNGNAATEGSVAKSVADSAAALTELIEAVEDKADAAQSAADKAQGEVDAVELDIGNVDGLSTENKTVVGAINEVLAAVGTGGTAAVVTMTSDTTTAGALKSYTIKQGTTTVGVIDIPKDMVVESGSVVKNPEGQAEGTYIKLVLANVAEPLYINVGTLVDIYKAHEGAAQVQVAIDSATREISASIVAGSVTSVELADNAVVTAKIADANVTKAKLSTAVQTSLDKADAAATKADFDAEVERAKAAEAQALTDAKAYTDGLIEAEKGRAEGIEGGLETRLQAVEAKFGDGEGNVEAQIEAAKEAAISESNKYTDDTISGLDLANTYAAKTHGHEIAEVAGLEDALAGKQAVGDYATKAEAQAMADGKDGAIAEAKKAGTDASAALEAYKTTNDQAVADNADAIASLEAKVGEGFVAIQNSEIDTLFA